MPQYGTWIPYTGSAAIILAAVLLVVAVVLAFWGTRLHRSLAALHPGRFAGILLVVLWILCYLTLGNSIITYYQAIVKEYGAFTPPTNPISNVTALAGLVSFIVIVYLAKDYGWKMAIESAIAGPMIFELPFDLIVMWRIYPRPTPMLQLTLLYFYPLFLWELASFLLVTLSTAASLSRYTLFAIAAMFFVFAVWAVFGFSYPSAPIPIALNAVSKILAFVTAITLFLPGKRTAQRTPNNEEVPLL
jgi:hypothetical protein